MPSFKHWERDQSSGANDLSGCDANQLSTRRELAAVLTQLNNISLWITTVAHAKCAEIPLTRFWPDLATVRQRSDSQLRNTWNFEREFDGRFVANARRIFNYD